MRRLWRYWGYVLLILLVMSWGWIRLGPIALTVVTTAATGYFLFQAPAWCGAVNRGGTYCRENANGLLRGCHRRAHKWQKLHRTWSAHSWGQITKALFCTPATGLATVSMVVAIVAGVGKIVEPMLH